MSRGQSTGQFFDDKAWRRVGQVSRCGKKMKSRRGKGRAIKDHPR